MVFNNKLIFLLVVLMLQACSSIKKPYSKILQSSPEIINTSIGNVEIWEWEPSPVLTSISKGTAYLIPGFPGSSLDNASLAQKLIRKGYSVKLINPPGHGRSAISNTRWHYQFDQYGRTLYESIQNLETGTPANTQPTIIAHSAGAEMLFNWLLLQMKKGDLPKQYNIVLINPWLPSISNHPIPWTEDDENILKYSPLLVKLFGPISKSSTHKRLFSDLSQRQNADYLMAHEKLTESLNGWGAFNNRFVSLLINTTRTQKNILIQGNGYPLPAKKIIQLRKFLRLAKIKILVINSSTTNDKIIPIAYKTALKKALEMKLPDIDIKFVDILKGGHMLQIEQPQRIIDIITP